MSSYTQYSAPLDIRYDAEASRLLGADHWRVTRGFRYYVGAEDSDRWVDIPAGYLTDGASVPRLLWSLVPPWGAYGQAAVVHDYLCENLQLSSGQPITRREADRTFLEALRVLGVRWYLVGILYLGVSAYRLVADVHRPSRSEKKQALERAWVA